MNFSQVDGIYFTPSVIESFIHFSLTLLFHSSSSSPSSSTTSTPTPTAINCTSWKDCRNMTNGYCIYGQCFASNAYFHDALDPAFKRTFLYHHHHHHFPDISLISFTSSCWSGYVRYKHHHSKSTIHGAFLGRLLRRRTIYEGVPSKGKKIEEVIDRKLAYGRSGLLSLREWLSVFSHIL